MEVPFSMIATGPEETMNEMIGDASETDKSKGREEYEVPIEIRDGIAVEIGDGMVVVIGNRRGDGSGDGLGEGDGDGKGDG